MLLEKLCLCRGVCVCGCENIWHSAWHWVGIPPKLLKSESCECCLQTERRYAFLFFFISLVSPVVVCLVQRHQTGNHFFQHPFPLYSCVRVGQRDLICIRSRRLKLQGSHSSLKVFYFERIDRTQRFQPVLAVFHLPKDSACRPAATPSPPLDASWGSTRQVVTQTPSLKSPHEFLFMSPFGF